MRISQTYFQVTATVIPTLLIALAFTARGLEIGKPRPLRPPRQTPTSDEASARIVRALVLFVALILITVTGEAISLGAVLTQHGTRVQVFEVAFCLMYEGSLLALSLLQGITQNIPDDIISALTVDERQRVWILSQVFGYISVAAVIIGAVLVYKSLGL